MSGIICPICGASLEPEAMREHLAQAHEMEEPKAIEPEIDEAEREAMDDLKTADKARLTSCVARMMDAIEEDFGDQYEIGAVVIVAHVHGHKNGECESGIRTRIEASPWAALGMLEMAKDIIR